MSMRQRTPLVLLWLAALLVPTCYRARIDLTPPAPNAGEGGGSGDATSGSESTESDAGGGGQGNGGELTAGGAAGHAVEGMVGGAGTAGADAGNGGADAAGAEAGSGGAGGDAGVKCERALEPLQEECSQFGLPLPATCHQTTPTGWDGCIDGGCNVCVEAVVDYPYYFKWHPCCTLNTTCGGQALYTCNERCPAPTERDKTAPCWASTN